MIRLAAALLAALAAVGAASAAKPRPPRVDPTCTTAAERRLAIRFRATDGATLVGLVLGPARARAGVVLSHESDGEICGWLPYGRRLARLGYRVLVYTARGYGSSPLPRRRTTRYELDVAGAAAELRRRGVQRVVLVGGSMGAMSSLIAGAAVRPAVAGVVAVSPGLSFRGLNPLRHVPALRVPVLYVVAEDDGDFSAQVRTLHDATGSRDKRLVAVPGVGHGRGLVYGREPEPVRVRAEIEAFLRERTRAASRVLAAVPGAAADVRLLANEVERIHPDPFH